MPGCERYPELISASLDGALTDAERAALDAHLTSCPSCRALLEDLAALRAGCADWGEESPPEGFADRVAAAAAAEGRPGKVLFFLRYRTIFAAAAVAAVVLLAVRTGEFPAFSGARGGAQAEMEVAAGTTDTLSNALSEENTRASAQGKNELFGTDTAVPPPEPTPGASADGGAARFSGAGETAVGMAGDALPAEGGAKAATGDGLYAAMSPEATETALCGGMRALPELPEGAWAWVLVLTGEEPDWPVDVTPVEAGGEGSARFFSAAASNRAALEEAFATCGYAPYDGADTVPNAERGLVCLLPA